MFEDYQPKRLLAKRQGHKSFRDLSVGDVVEVELQDGGKLHIDVTAVNANHYEGSVRLAISVLPGGPHSGEDVKFRPDHVLRRVP